MTLPNEGLTTIWSNNRKSKLLVAYMKQGEVTLNIDSEKLKIITNGRRMLLTADGDYRNSTRGLCGAMSGDPMTELIAPRDCYMTNQTLYGAMWAMTNEAQCDVSVKELNRQAKADLCVKNINPGTTITIPKDTKNEPKPSVVKSRISSMKCRVHRSSQYEVEDGKICISVDPLPVCSQDCSREGNYVKEVN